MVIFEWRVENASMAALLHGECLRSSTFYIEESRTLEFCLKLFPNACNGNCDNKEATLLLWRCDDSATDVQIKYELTVSDNNNSITKSFYQEFAETKTVNFSENCVKRTISFPTRMCMKIVNVTCKIKQHRSRKSNIADLEDLSAAFASLLQCSILPDTTVQLGTRIFNVHKAIIGTRCPPLLEKFEKLKICADSRITVDVFYKFLLYLYSGKFDDCDVSDGFYALLKILDVSSPECLSIPHPIFTFSKTVVSVEHISFEMSIENFLDPSPNKILSYQVSEGNPRYSLKLLIFRHRNQMGRVFPKFMIRRFNHDTNMLICCTISVKQSFGIYKQLFKYSHLFKIGTTDAWKLPTEYRSYELQPKSVYLPNGVLHLLINLKMNTGEYETNVTDVHFPQSPFPYKYLYRLGEDFKKLLENPIYSDVILKVCDVAFPAHKAILSAWSPVFHCMFQHDTQEQRNGEIIIKDFSTECVHALLSYIYSGQLERFDFDLVAELYYAANKYQMLRLRNKCSMLLESLLSADNANEILILADFHCDSNFKRNVSDWIRFNM